MTCENCKNKVVLWAFSDYQCHICGTEGSSGHTPPQKVCMECAVKNKLCIECGEPLDLDSSPKGYYNG
jgi:hypothetical protein